MRTAPAAAGHVASLPPMAAARGSRRTNRAATFRKSHDFTLSYIPSLETL